MITLCSIDDLNKYKSDYNFAIVHNYLYQISGVRHYPSLAPSTSLFTQMKDPNRRLTTEEYFIRFNKEMKSPKFMMALYDLLDIVDKGNDITLMCYCKDYNLCHRFSLYKLIKSIGYDCDIH